MRRRYLVFIGVAVSAIFLWLALRETDFESIGEAIGTADARWAAPFLLTLFAFYWLKSSRWSHLLSPVLLIRGKDLFPAVMVGYAGTAILPMQMGEFVRAYIASKQTSLPYSQVLSSIFMERVFDLLTILALLGLLLAAGQSTPALLVNAGYIIASITAIGMVAAIFLATKTETALSVASLLFSWIPGRLRQQILIQLDAAAGGLQSMTRPRLFVRIAINSIAQWSLMGLCIWLSLLALDIHVSASAAILVLVATIIGISLPSSPGYIGNIQLAFVVALEPFGISAEPAIAASLFYHVLAYVSVVVVGFSFLHKSGYNLSEFATEAMDSKSNSN